MKCANPYCQSERWRGPNGTNDKLTLCEFHQKEAWNRYKREKQARQPMKVKTPKPPKPRKVKAVKTKPAPQPPPKPRRYLLYDPRDGRLQRVEVRVLGDLPVQTYDPETLIALYRALGASTIHVVGDLGLQVDNTQLTAELGQRIAELKARQS